MDQDILEIAVKPPKVFRVNGADYSLEFPLRSVIHLEAKIGRSMKSSPDWFRIQTKEVPEVIYAGLLKNHSDTADVVTEAICSGLDPEEIETVIYALTRAACPLAMARFDDEVAKAQERMRKGLPLPNGQSADGV
ncbi:MAG TPA: hypothetical protein VHY59_08585 [Chthoniobacterales bacterium]|jgi:hypothetical protein|nr:hypothetical protein [Chthoniobacterales bacterium]